MPVRVPRVAVSGIGSVIVVVSLSAQAQERDPMLIHDSNGLMIRTHLQAGLNAVAERNLFWDLGAATAPASGFNPDTE